MKNIEKSFTLIEILIVIAIISILSTLIISGMNSIPKNTRDAKRITEISRIRNAIWSGSNMGINGYPITPDQGSGSRATCCLGTGDSTNCSAVEAVIGGVIPKDPLYTGTNKEWCYNYKSDGITFDLYAKLELGGAVSLSETKTTTVKPTDDCGTGWINTGLGFCVMQYEAKITGNDDGNQVYSSAFVPESRSTGTPWVGISQINAIAECKSIGAHLISNAEWMALARDIESVSSNYVSGVLKRGNVGDTATGDYDGANPEAGVTNSLATLTLSNGQQIHHLSGNVFEWIDYTISGVGSQPKDNDDSTWAWNEFSAIDAWGTMLGYENVGPKNTFLNGSTGAGRIYSANTDVFSTLRALMRGGGWANTSNSGVFLMHTSSGLADIGVSVGFRCAR
ncbi:MAG TPA: prepilin-type N-terminal cleavage/methylation domain-containing protein [Candidatus Pacearchaeota archaeon]|nr:prepilin-type N-terminal cleavage/methylation domain-containing protein [Candidatus Pacearchaeota archaeon]